MPFTMLLKWSAIYNRGGVCVFLFNSPSSTHSLALQLCSEWQIWLFIAHSFFIFISIEQAGVAEINDTSMFENIWNSWNNNFLLSRGGEEKFNSFVNGNCCCKRRRRGGFFLLGCHRNLLSSPLSWKYFKICKFTLIIRLEKCLYFFNMYIFLTMPRWAYFLRNYWALSSF